MKALKHPLFLSVLTAIALYVLFAHILNPPLPNSLLVQYMIISIVGILLVTTFSDDSAARMGEPIAALFGDPDLKSARLAALIAVVLGVGGFTYSVLKPNFDAPVELRTVHPAPPSSIKVYGKSFNLLKLTNPLREKAPKGTREYKQLVSEGGELYYKNCMYCHGDLLDGEGHFAQGFNPRPINFQDVGTIAQLQESFLFWRITTGGPGLPREGAPWASAMPVWHEMLKEDDVWKLITFIYDYTGHEPRSWELAKDTGHMDKAEDKPKVKSTRDAKLDEEQVKAVYTKRCSHCHGEDGDGLGPAAQFLYPKPRDFTLGQLKYKSTHADHEYPSIDDLRRTIKEGLPGTSMPGWKSLLSDAEIDGLIDMIRVFGSWTDEDLDEPLKSIPIDEGTPVKSSPESLARGSKLFQKACKECHGILGLGNITSGKKLKDDWQDRIWPRNLTRPETWRSARDVRDVFYRISTGIRGTPMPEHSTTMKAQDRWDIANYVMALRDTTTQLTKGDTVVRGVKITGKLPDTPDHEGWKAARPITFPLVPNIIKEPRLYKSLNDTVTVRVLYNESEMAIRLDVDDRTFSVPGSKLEKQYRIEGIEPTHDAIAVQFPVTIPNTSEKPWFRHGDKKHPVNMWVWSAPGEEPKRPEALMMLDATGPDAPPKFRKDYKHLSGKGAWRDGRWTVVLRRPLKTDDKADLQMVAGRYIPIAFANWDGVEGHKGGRHALSTWYWLLLEPDVSMAALYGKTGGAALLAGLVFLLAVRRQRKRFAGRA